MRSRSGAASVPSLLYAAAAAGAILVSGCQWLPASQEPAAAGRAAPGRFTDIAQQAGLNYRWSVPGKRPLNILQTIGNGCALFDFDNDGSLDVLLVGRRPALFKGDGRGRFTDVTRACGLTGLSGQFLGCAVGDVDGDGWRDVYLTGYRAGVLLKNVSGVRFQDVTRKAGLRAQPWSTSAAFAETSPGGRLDLYVANYVRFGPNVEPQLCLENRVVTSCGPRYYDPIKGALYRNIGGGRFIDVTRASGAREAGGRALGVAAADYDDSGRPAFAIANDEMPGDLLRQSGHGRQVRYTNAGKLSGTAYDRDGNVHGGMGIDWGDYDNDGRLDLFVGTFQNETKSLYHNDGDGSFTDMGIPTGIGAAAAPYVTFGSKFFDFDNDGWLDIVLANGHVQDNIEQINSSTTYRQPTLLFRNPGRSPIFFEDVSSGCGPDLSRPIVGRGLAIGDIDNDGRIDVLVVDSEGEPLLLRNETSGAGHWIGVALEGTTSNRDGYGALIEARLEATHGGKKLVRQCHTDGSYMSASDPRVHFGLGDAANIESLTVKWPSGRTDTYRDLPIDRYIRLREGGQAPVADR